MENGKLSNPPLSSRAVLHPAAGCAGVPVRRRAARGQLRGRGREAAARGHVVARRHEDRGRGVAASGEPRREYYLLELSMGVREISPCPC